MADTLQTNGEVSSGSWSDAEHITSLKRLQDLQSQINNLRAALPSLINPLTTPPNPSPLSTASPNTVYTEFAANAAQALEEVKRLRETWESEETKKILEYAEESLEAESDMDWEFVKKGRWGEIPEDEADLDVEMKSEEPSQDIENAKEDGGTSG